MSTSRTAAGSAQRGRGRLVLGATVALGASGAAALVLLVAAGGAPAASPAGIPDAGAVTGWALPAASLLGQVLAVAVAGSLLVPLLVMTEVGEVLDGTAHRAVHMVRGLGLAWAVAVATEIVLTVSDQYALPVWALRPVLVADFVVGVDQGRMMALQLALVAGVSVAARWALTVRESSAVLGLALLAVVPPVLTGHSAASGSHDTAVVSLLLHVLAVVVWVGGVVALWWHLGTLPAQRRVAARRFSGLAAWCFAVTALSGAANAMVRLSAPADLLTTGYGLGVVAKLAALGAAGLVAVRVRAALGGAGADRPARSIGLLIGTELVVMFVALGLGVALARTPPPVGEIYTTAAQSLIGGPLPPPPTPQLLLLGFTPSGVGLAVVVGGAVLYAAGVLRLARRGTGWPRGRTLSWFAGLLVVAWATSGGLGVYSHVLFSAHMAAHMLLSMVAPIFLVLGAPVPLALRALPGSDRPGGTGPRHLLAGALRSRPLRLLTHPVVAAAIFVGSVYVVYLSGLFDLAMATHLGHAAMELHFLLAGFLFFEVLIGSAPIRRPPFLGRVALLLLTMPLHAFFAITVMASTRVIGGDFYRLLDRPYAADLLADQNLGGSLTWALGEVPMVILLLVLLAQWYRSDRRDADRFDRRAARDDDAELRAYNERLRGLSADPGRPAPR